MGKQDFEARRDALLQDIRSMMDDVQELYDNSVEEGTKEAKEAKAKLQVKLDAAKEKLGRFEEEAAKRVKYHAEQAKERFAGFGEEAGERFKRGKECFDRFEEEAAERVKHRARQADEAVREKPYYAMGFAALAGLVVGVLLNRR